MRCLYRCFLPRVKGRMCDSGKVLVWKNITSVCWKLALLAPWRWGSASWQRKRHDWYIGIISEGPWMWGQVAYVWCRLAGEGSRGMGREGWRSQSSGLAKAHLWEYSEKIWAGQGCAVKAVEKDVLLIMIPWWQGFGQHRQGCVFEKYFEQGRPQKWRLGLRGRQVGVMSMVSKQGVVLGSQGGHSLPCLSHWSLSWFFNSCVEVLGRDGQGAHRDQYEIIALPSWTGPEMRVGREKGVQVRRQNLHRKLSSIRISLEENVEDWCQDSQE